MQGYSHFDPASLLFEVLLTMEEKAMPVCLPNRIRQMLLLVVSFWQMCL